MRATNSIRFLLFQRWPARAGGSAVYLHVRANQGAELLKIDSYPPPLNPLCGEGAMQGHGSRCFAY